MEQDLSGLHTNYQAIWEAAVARWPQLASDEARQRYSRRCLCAAWDLIHFRFKADNWARYSQILRTATGSLEWFHRIRRRLRCHLVEDAKQQQWQLARVLELRVLAPAEPWVPPIILFKAIVHYLTIRARENRVSKDEFLSSILLPVSHWCLPPKTYQLFADLVTDPLDLVGLVRTNYEWVLGVRLNCLADSPLRAELLAHYQARINRERQRKLQRRLKRPKHQRWQAVKDMLEPLIEESFQGRRMPNDATLFKLVRAQAQVPISRRTFYRLKQQVKCECLNRRILREIQKAESQQAVLPLVFEGSDSPSQANSD